MSGFDFDSLRDPLAPEPGARERAGVEARARELRARRLRNRLATSTAAIVVVAALVLAVIGTQHNSGPEIAVPGTSTTTITSPTTAGPSVDNRFVPPATMQDGLVVLPVTLPDGETFTMKYPPAMRIAQLGFGGNIEVNGLTVVIDYTTLQHIYGDPKPIATYAGVDGTQVLYLDPAPIACNGCSIPQPGQQKHLVFQFGHWLVRVVSAQALTNQQRAMWARNLSGTADANGFLVLNARSPLTIGVFNGGFGNGSPNSVNLLTHATCTPPASDPNARQLIGRTPGGSPVAAWCIDAHSLVQVIGSLSFVELAANKLQISGITSDTSPTTATSTTTTTQPVVTSSAPALSATWVSPTHGWVLERSGAVIETNDGGATWTRVGSVAVPSGLERHLRFADASHGFVFTTDPTGTAPLLETVDGGAHWAASTTPFSVVSDLDISDGVVYVVGVPNTTGKDFPGFRIWSAPISTLHWSMDPLPIEVGAGPVPFQYLTFAGGHGWMVNIDRDTGSGGRLSSPNAQWTAWTPPCVGSTDLAAPTATDVVAVCGPAFATSATRSTIAFSHNGGTTFGRAVTLPAGSGGIPLSPNPDTAIIEAGGKLERTTDDGATWQVVAQIPNAYPISDGGFTTTTQGFVIFGNGLMYMTHDAGGTWQRARLP